MQNRIKSKWFVQNGTSNDETPATVKPMLFTSRGVMYGSFVIQPERNRAGVLLKPK